MHTKKKQSLKISTREIGFSSNDQFFKCKFFFIRIFHYILHPLIECQKHCNECSVYCFFSIHIVS